MSIKIARHCTVKLATTTNNGLDLFLSCFKRGWRIKRKRSKVEKKKNKQTKNKNCNMGSQRYPFTPKQSSLSNFSSGYVMIIRKWSTTKKMSQDFETCVKVPMK